MNDVGRDPRALLAPAYHAYVERLSASGSLPINELSVTDARRFMRDTQQADVSGYPVTTERHAVDDLSVLVLKPERCEAPLPAIAHFHGGGWVLGDAGTHARMAREVTLAAGAAVVFVEYRRAPEAQSPQPFEQRYQALEWIQKRGRGLGLDPSRLAVAGDSKGGNLAAAVSMPAAQRA